jgi:hypothetical protein
MDAAQREESEHLYVCLFCVRVRERESARARATREGSATGTNYYYP